MSASSDLGALGRRALRWLAWFHRWAGIVLCLLFALWFASGAVLTFVPFPSLGEGERLAASETIDGAKIKIAPDAVPGQAGGALSLISVVGRPVYLITRPGLPTQVIAADNGAAISDIGASAAGDIAKAFGRAAVKRISGPLFYDQWVVHNQFDTVRPFYRVRLEDRAHTDLYVSARTGQVLQRTTQIQRNWNWCGAVLHWIYFTPIRAHWSFWDYLVWWVSLVSLVVVIAGIWLGLQRTLKLWSLGRKKLSPFRGWLGWHHIIGLFASIFVLIWMFSGWLSMDHGRLFSRGGAGPSELARFAGLKPTDIARAVSVSDLRALRPAAEIDFAAISRQPYFVARGGDYKKSSLFEPGKAGISGVSDTALLVGLTAAWPEAPWQAKGAVSADDLYVLAEGMPAGTRRFDQQGSGLSVYIDPALGRIVAVMDVSRRQYAWFYYALHTFNFPGVSARPLLRYVMILLPLALGFVFSITGVVIGVQRLKREFVRPGRL